ncbi:MAG: purine-binding chemotaxis protein CheW [Fuerstiella sp.]|nr:purine-binding chemotaxis protein CheW [Planctomycetota bacterium]MCP4858204.1 purine-binding chemotaxis protein CheW [Fuerstiella sp.]
MSSTPSQSSSHRSRDNELEGIMQLVSFQLGKEEYGVEISLVREIILVGEITQVPQTSPHVKGLINLRGKVIPVVDLNLRFGLPAGEPTGETRIVLIDTGGKTIGVIVDAVNKVRRISRDQIAPAPPTVAGLGREYLIGLATLDDRLLILLDIEKALCEEVQQEAEATLTSC